MSIAELRAKYAWKEVMFEDETIAELSWDGLEYRFLPEQVVQKLKGLPEDEDGWFFNSSRDRYCAEKLGKYIRINPSKVIDLFGYPVIIA